MTTNENVNIKIWLQKNMILHDYRSMSRHTTLQHVQPLTGCLFLSSSEFCAAEVTVIPSGSDRTNVPLSPLNSLSGTQNRSSRSGGQAIPAAGIDWSLCDEIGSLSNRLRWEWDLFCCSISSLSAFTFSHFLFCQHFQFPHFLLFFT